jgi:hypothetical protein
MSEYSDKKVDIIEDIRDFVKWVKDEGRKVKSVPWIVGAAELDMIEKLWGEYFEREEDEKENDR